MQPVLKAVGLEEDILVSHESFLVAVERRNARML